MRTYSVDELSKNGAAHALALVLQHVSLGEEPFVTYGQIASLLEARLSIPKIFPTHIGPVAGRFMHDIEEVDPSAPPINALVTRDSGIPGDGFGSFYDRLWRKRGEPGWASLGRKRKLEAVAEIRAAVRRFPGWENLFSSVYEFDPKSLSRPKKFTEQDGKKADADRPRGLGESHEHKRLKKWVADNPLQIGLSPDMVPALEADLLSGDRIDVLFSNGSAFVAVEVKSVRSSVDDWKRGIYQCVKYRAVLEAQQLPVKASVKALLVSENELTPELKVRARDLGVGLSVHGINSKA